MACLNCKTLIELMQKEIEELKNKQVQLLQINATLQEATSEVHQNSHVNWKAKYHEQLNKYQQLKSNLENTLLQMSPIKKNPQQINQDELMKRNNRLWASQKVKISVKMEPKRQSKSSLKSVRQMDNYMQSIQKEQKYRTISQFRKSLPFHTIPEPLFYRS